MKSYCFYCLDDDIDDLELFHHAVAALGHRASLFMNADVMLTALANSPLPDAIFLDIHMPMMNGEEMLTLLRRSEHLKHIPVVMISGACPKKLVRSLTDEGACGLMKKPHGTPWKDSLMHTLTESLYPIFHLRRTHAA
jgi:CheY-like chemotaxis protein